MAKARPLGNVEKELLQSYEQQLDMIGAILIRAKLITRHAIQRDGVAFAVRNRFEPPRSFKKAARKS